MGKTEQKRRMVQQDDVIPILLGLAAVILGVFAIIGMIVGLFYGIRNYIHSIRTVKKERERTGYFRDKETQEKVHTEAPNGNYSEFVYEECARKSYFLGPCFTDVGKVIKGAFSENFATIPDFSRGDTWYSRIAYFVWSLCQLVAQYVLGTFVSVGYVETIVESNNYIISGIRPKPEYSIKDLEPETKIKGRLESIQKEINELGFSTLAELIDHELNTETPFSSASKDSILEALKDIKEKWSKVSATKEKSQQKANFDKICSGMTLFLKSYEIQDYIKYLNWKRVNDILNNLRAQLTSLNLEVLNDKPYNNTVDNIYSVIYFEEKEDAIVYCNDEFLLHDFAPNRFVGEILVHGTFFVVGNTRNDEGEWESCSLTEEQIAKYTEKFCAYLVPLEKMLQQNEEECEESEDIGLSQN